VQEYQLLILYCKYYLQGSPGILEHVHYLKYLNSEEENTII